MKLKLLFLIIFLMFCVLSFTTKANLVDPVLVQKFTLFEKATKCKLLITSAHRTREHNKAIGGAKNSMHLQGKAYDFVKHTSCKKSYDELGEMAKSFFNGVIIYPTHIHVDIAKRKFFRRIK